MVINDEIVLYVAAIAMNSCGKLHATNIGEYFSFNSPLATLSGKPK